MPLHQRVNIDEQTQILIWHIEEPLEQLKKDLKLAKADEIRLPKAKDPLPSKRVFGVPKTPFGGGYSSPQFES